MNNPKYPKTPYHPESPSKGSREDRIHSNPDRFVDTPILITEKLDGSNTMIHQGQVYNRSVAAPSLNKWNAMVKKHHAWKILAPDTYVYGENLFGIHSIKYDAMYEEETFRVFAIRYKNHFFSVDDMTTFCLQNNIPIVPILYSISASAKTINEIMKEPTGKSHLGTTREGLVMRVREKFHINDFKDCVCKSVRPNHVQTDTHWSHNWKPCKLI